MGPISEMVGSSLSTVDSDSQAQTQIIAAAVGAEVLCAGDNAIVAECSAAVAVAASAVDAGELQAKAVGLLEAQEHAILSSYLPVALDGALDSLPISGGGPNDLNSKAGDVLEGEGRAVLSTFTATLQSTSDGSAPGGNANDLKSKAVDALEAEGRAVLLSYVAKVPVVGALIRSSSTSKDASPLDPSALVSETSPLLGEALRASKDPKAFAEQRLQALATRLTAPIVNRLPDVEALDNKTADQGLLVKILVEIFVLGKYASGLFFTYIQEHSLLIAPTISLGHLSTTDLAASTIGGAAASVTGYSIVQGFISALDGLLASSPDHRTSQMWCARAALITALVLIPITNLWLTHSERTLLYLGQSPEVASLASDFLGVSALGMPAYAMGEIAKRYLASQGLSAVHTSILTTTAPLNMLMNYLLVDGPIPALRLGFAGAPLSTALSHNFIAVLLVLYIAQRAVRSTFGHHPPSPPQNDNSNNNVAGSSVQTQEPSRPPCFWHGMLELAVAGLSGVGRSASQLWSKDLGGLAASVLGPNALATQAVLLTTATTLHQAPRALSGASSDRMKKWLSKGEVQRARIAAAVALVGTIIGVIVISNILLISSASWGEMFNKDPLVLQSVAAVIPFIALFQAVHGLGAWIDGSLSALGKSAVYPALNASGDYFVGAFRIPLGLYLAFVRHWGLAGLWTGLVVSLLYSCVVAGVALLTADWSAATSVSEEPLVPEMAQTQREDDPSGLAEHFE
ncbi:hypothetical protein BV22DRAFT_1054993 [Leucogyrophana mollusca]|uniref:Uncharacterized protein n=1 Tax=Leucogyrophana mollusca TaxID=85980 RepID=A0ACB8C0L8_9AGAM|nr:hypothetical protein BV22DRAFT_1054993 [Leucogyrophana mollusca]